LFSQPRVADFINKTFEPVWISVRPVPIVRIDFGNGKVLTRTLHGNILTSVVTPDGLVLDALPGIYSEDVYLDRLDQLRLLAAYAALQGGAKWRADFVKGYHERQAAALARDQKAEVFVDKLKARDRSKRLIELSLESVLQKADAVAAKGESKGEARTGSADVAGWKELVEDTVLNETARRRQIHELLAKQGLVKPDRVLKPIYKDVLHADLDDPYLGLGETLFKNYPFAKEDAAKP
jgi:hypothetical protein